MLTSPQYETMHEDNEHRLDYFQFAYEGVSESDDPDSTSSRRNSRESGGAEGGRSGGQSHRSGATDTSAASTAPEPSARSRMMDAIMAIEWSGVNKELRKERAEIARSNKENNPFRLDLSEATMTGEGEEQRSAAEESKGQPSPSSGTQNDQQGGEDGGFPLECMGAGILLESMFETSGALVPHQSATRGRPPLPLLLPTTCAHHLFALCGHPEVVGIVPDNTIHG